MPTIGIQFVFNSPTASLGLFWSKITVNTTHFELGFECTWLTRVSLMGSWILQVLHAYFAKFFLNP